jgi:hypothetical protein
MIRVTPVRWVTVGALLTVAGLTIAATAPIAGTEGSERMQAQQSAGGVAVVVGWAVLAWGIHRLGREGRR